MSDFKRYIHIERIEKVQDDMLKAESYIAMPKLDGTNASVWSDKEGNIHAGSRNREVNADKDNAGFYAYITTSQEESVVALREFLRENPNYIVYGEFLGTGKKFLGTIKGYEENGFFIFDVWNRDTAEFLPHSEWYAEFSSWYPRCVPAIYYDHFPTPKEQKEILKSDFLRYNLANSETAYPEGVVIKGEPACRDPFGNIKIGKIILDEFKKNHDHDRKKLVYEPGELEEEFVNKYITEAFLSKCKSKIDIAIGEDAPQPKKVGMFMNLVIDDLMTEEFWDFFKKKKTVVDLAIIVQLAKQKAADYIL